METLSGYLGELTRLFAATELTDASGQQLASDEGAKTVLALMQRVKSAGTKAMVVGNGGSAAIASHMQNDLCKALRIPTVAMTEQPLLTALANDDGYETAYETLVKLWARADDLLFAISSSGQSENILRAARAARKAGCRVVTLSGFAADNPLRQLGDVNFYVPSRAYGHVEIAHASITQFLTDALIGN
jgi:D-sedoheptulose 7-phosphate isomerase